MHTAPDQSSSVARRVAGVLVGAGGVVGGVQLLGSAGSVPVFVVEGLFVAWGFDLLVTGVLGYCPLWSDRGVSNRTRDRRQP